MDVILKPASATTKKLKRKSRAKVTTSEPKNIKLNTSDALSITTLKPVKPVKDEKQAEFEEFSKRYPILKNQELVDRFLKVPMTNNQKGRIRQAVRDSLNGTSNVLVPEIIHSKIQSILRSSDNLTDSELRRIRILYNLLKTALKGEKVASETVKPKVEQVKSKRKVEEDSPKVKEVVKKKKEEKHEPREQLVKRVKGPKRYVVFLGNLPLDIDKEKIMNHFSEMNEHIIDIRLPKNAENKKSAIAYLELSNEPSYEFALSKHHSMLGSKRINVLYTAPKKGKVSKANAKGKSAKLIALQKSGKLVGSLPLAKKRSQRRLKKKQAEAKLTANAV
ncbi:nucleolar protein 6-like [Trichoplusia ni]|uniref:Nucleolar protein 6-like n=1 Tax=Trichoplusia ni TaxID=7111 RepID=A0A7E5WP85_TRINI|nr:nucleolar protein 6-like [Trichoplusia ni]